MWQRLPRRVSMHPRWVYMTDLIQLYGDEPEDIRVVLVLQEETRIPVADGERVRLSYDAPNCGSCGYVSSSPTLFPCQEGQEGTCR